MSKVRIANSPSSDKQRTTNKAENKADEKQIRCVVSVCKPHEHNGWMGEEGDEKEEKRFLHQSIAAIGASVRTTRP